MTDGTNGSTLGCGGGAGVGVCVCGGGGWMQQSHSDSCCSPTHGIAKEAAEDNLDCIHMSVWRKPLEKAKIKKKENFYEDRELRLSKKKKIAAGSPERSGQEVKGSSSKTNTCNEMQQGRRS